MGSPFGFPASSRALASACCTARLRRACDVSISLPRDVFGRVEVDILGRLWRSWSAIASSAVARKKLTGRRSYKRFNPRTFIIPFVYDRYGGLNIIHQRYRCARPTDPRWTKYSRPCLDNPPRKHMFGRFMFYRGSIFSKRSRWDGLVSRAIRSEEFRGKPYNSLIPSIQNELL